MGLLAGIIICIHQKTETTGIITIGGSTAIITERLLFAENLHALSQLNLGNKLYYYPHSTDKISEAGESQT